MVFVSRSVRSFSQFLRRDFAAAAAEGEQQQEQQISRVFSQQEELWRDLFLNPSFWWDNRRTKTNPAYPDFRHKHSQQPLWLDNRQKPAWVDSWLHTLHVHHDHHDAHHGAHDDCHDHHDAHDNDRRVQHGYAGHAHHDHHHHAHHGHHDAHENHRRVQHTQNQDQHAHEHDHHTRHHFDDGLHPFYQQQYRAQNYGKAFTADDQLSVSLSHPEELSRALKALFHMHTAPSTATYMRLLKACINCKSLSHAKQVCSHLIHYSTPLNGLLGDYLVVTLAKCGAVNDALDISATLRCLTVFSWTAIISAYAERGCGREALKLCTRMLEDGVEPNHFTFVSLFQACGSIPDLEQGRKLHADARQRGLISNLFVGNSLVSMYVKCGAVNAAEEVFSGLLQRDVVSWNTMIAAYVELGQAEKALRLYRQMQEDGGSPDHLTIMSALQACSTLAGKGREYGMEGCVTESMPLKIGQALHAEAHKKSWTLDIVVATALVVMYGKCGVVALAENVFHASLHYDTVIWNAMLAAYLEQGRVETVLHIYVRMQRERVTLDEVTCIYSLQACGKLGSLEVCHQLHFDVVSAGCDSLHSMAAALIQTYRSSASMLDAHAFFIALSDPDYVSWTACIAGHAGDGNSIATLRMFEHLKLAGIKPDEILLTAVLFVCSHVGLVAVGLEYFRSSTINYGTIPHLKHYGIMLDLLGRAGNFKGVELFLKQMPMQADLTIWLSLLGACCMHGHVELAKHAFDHVVTLEPEQTFAYILMANIYVDAGMQESAADVEIARHKMGTGTRPSHSLELYSFLS